MGNFSPSSLFWSQNGAHRIASCRIDLVPAAPNTEPNNYVPTLVRSQFVAFCLIDKDFNATPGFRPIFSQSVSFSSAHQKMR